MSTSTPENRPTIALLGIGMMGFPMGRRLCESGYTVQAWNRTRDKADRLAPFGAQVFDHAADAASGADVLITMLENGDIVEQVLFGAAGAPGAAAALKPGAVVVDMSSIKPAQARGHAQKLAAQGVLYLDAPVSGGTVGAEQGTLAVMAGGEASTFEQVKSIFAPLGRATHVGPSGSGQLAKLANQMIVGITIGAVAEALLLCEKGGANMAQVKEAITGGFADSRILQVHGQRMVDRDFAPRARMTVQHKDLRNALDTAGGLGFVAPITGLLEQLYAQGIAHGHQDLDHAGLFVELAERNGMR
ncbi:MAG: NAD(P)-dependent oxidoreductase [Betaproteobacteria bacterium]|nr:NAD(P)-dependent oxidoreductase [Betaproteobacteria bacterium]